MTTDAHSTMCLPNNKQRGKGIVLKITDLIDQFTKPLQYMGPIIISLRVRVHAAVWLHMYYNYACHLHAHVHVHCIGVAVSVATCPTSSP